MLKKALKKLSKVTSRHTSKPEKPSTSSQSPSRILTAEGWKRLMMKKTNR